MPFAAYRSTSCEEIEWGGGRDGELLPQRLASLSSYRPAPDQTRGFSTK